MLGDTGVGGTWANGLSFSLFQAASVDGRPMLQAVMAEYKF